MTLQELENDVRFTEVPKGKFDKGDRVFYIKIDGSRHGSPVKLCHVVFDVFLPNKETGYPCGISAHCQMTDYSDKTFNLDLLNADAYPLGEVTQWFRSAHLGMGANYIEE